MTFVCLNDKIKIENSSKVVNADKDKEALKKLFDENIETIQQYFDYKFQVIQCFIDQNLPNKHFLKPLKLMLNNLRDLTQPKIQIKD